ncbi:MAG TPA: hypothetical protein VI386_22020 [Candidatus Sulfotelmatobacter sp.]
MDQLDLIKALTVPFFAGLVVQRLVEILDTYTTAKIANDNAKKFVVGILSLIFSLLLVGFGHIYIFTALKWPMDTTLDLIASGIFISGGSEGFNSLMKFANYKKEASRGDAADKLKNADPKIIKTLNPQTDPSR